MSGDENSSDEYAKEQTEVPLELEASPRVAAVRFTYCRDALIFFGRASRTSS